MPELLEGVGFTQNRFHKFDVYGHTLATVAATAVPDPVLRLGALLHDVGKPRARAPQEDAPGEYSFFKHEFVGAEMAVSICQPLEAVQRRPRERAPAGRQSHVLLHARTGPTAPSGASCAGSGWRSCRRCSRCARRTSRAGALARIPSKETVELRRRIAEVASADAALTVKDLAIDGRDVMQLLAVPPGRVIGIVLEALLERVLDDPGLNTREVLSALVPAVAAEAGDCAAPGRPTGRRLIAELLRTARLSQRNRSSIAGDRRTGAGMGRYEGGARDRFADQIGRRPVRDRPG